ncbi:MAG: alkaline phosphatase family protein [Oscillospiraceae bacterium]|jgi:hypothetical protein|nr:alkaline phosphatase family protein [Oscillospiraceae bacterium]
MTAKRKKLLKIILIPLAVIVVLIGGIYGGIFLSDRIVEKNYTKTLNDAGIFSAGQDANNPRPQTELAQIMWEHFNSPLLEGKTAKKALIIGLDGTRSDALANAVNPDESGILTLKAQGGVYPFYAGGAAGLEQGTWTASGWASLLTGKWADEEGGHNVHDNSESKAIEPKTVFTRLIEAGKIKSANFTVSWKGHLLEQGKTYAAEAEYTAKNGLDVVWQTATNDATTFAGAKAQIEQGRDFIFLILEYCDHAGHLTSFGNKNPSYRQAFLTADAQAKRLIDTVAARPEYDKEDWLILITTDHGGLGISHGGQSSFERNVFAACNKPL